MRGRSKNASILTVIGVGLLFAAIAVVEMAPQSSAETQAVADRAPIQLDDGWDVAKPSAAGFDAAALSALTETIESGAIPNVHAVIIEHSGRLVYEQYFRGRDERWGTPIGDVDFDRDSLHDLRSVTKSVTSALLGIALGSNYDAALHTPVTDYFGDLEGRFGEGVENVTLWHVLTMTAGLEWNEMAVPYTSRQNDEIRLYYTSDPIGMVLGRPVRDPVGTTWYYNGGLAQVLAGLIQRETGKRLDAFAEESLFEPLGIARYEWLGSSAWSPEESPSAASGLRLRARDLAKIGSLFLHDGRWKDREVIPAEWVELSTRRYVQDIPWSQDGAYGYGFMWYPGTWGPYSLTRAIGNGDQRLFIVPEAEIVVTVFAGNYNSFIHASGDKILSRVMATLSVDQ